MALNLMAARWDLSFFDYVMGIILTIVFLFVVAALGSVNESMKPKVPIFEKVYTIHDWQDGPVQGVVDYQSRPHIYTRVKQGDDEDVYQLTPISDEEFRIILEQYEIWKRWVMAHEEGWASKLTYPCLPWEQDKYDKLNQLTKPLFDIKKATLTVKGSTRPNLVRNAVGQANFIVCRVKAFI